MRAEHKATVTGYTGVESSDVTGLNSLSKVQLPIPPIAAMSLLVPLPPSETALKSFFDRQALKSFFDRHAHLLTLERGAEEGQTRLLNSNCSPKLLEQRGLALNGLGVSAINVGLGGKKWVLTIR